LNGSSKIISGSQWQTIIHHEKIKFNLMKNLLTISTFVFLTLLSSTSFGQYILSLNVSPSNPTTNDTVTILASCAFPSAGCDDHSQYYFVNGTTINAGALHCLGLATVICYYTDTFTIPPLPAGNYSFIFQVDAGLGPSPCTPGIVAGPTDSVNFIVSNASGVAENETSNFISIHPNPAHELLWITNGYSNKLYAVAEIYDVQGKFIKSFEMKSNSDAITVQELPNGFYIIKITTTDGFVYRNKFMKD
jgi:hypothetical protein